MLYSKLLNVISWLVVAIFFLGLFWISSIDFQLKSIITESKIDNYNFFFATISTFLTIILIFLTKDIKNLKKRYYLIVDYNRNLEDFNNELDLLLFSVDNQKEVEKLPECREFLSKLYSYKDILPAINKFRIINTWKYFNKKMAEIDEKGIRLLYQLKQIIVVPVAEE
ncbi:MAG: hypothetical protein OEZ22_13965 [Spirochaetia bacterium]|nr:hypothetical protein [Spirochaetia bacterium]